MNPPFKVLWNRRASDVHLAHYVVTAIEQGHSLAAITEAVARIEHALSTNPLEAGESRDSYERVIIALPLGVTFEVHEAEGIVYILKVRYSPAKGSEPL